MNPSVNQGRDEAANPVLDELIAEITDRLQAGDSVDVEQYAAQQPELAAELRRLLPALELLAAAGDSAENESRLEDESCELPLSGVLGDFRILREVGQGGMGIVYEAEQISLGRRVALKVLPFAATMDPRHLQRFHNEAQAAACLHHTNIVPVFSVGSDRGVHFYAMQFIDGQPLSDLIRQLRGQEQKTAMPSLEQTTPYPSLPAEAALSTPRPAGELTPWSSEGRRGRDYYRKVAEWGVQAAEALDHAHQLGIVHRDVKPGNLLLDGRGNLWVTDFGLAQVQQREASLTVTGQAVGTPRYMSPEQALTQRVPVDHRTDVYSLGATLYELLTLRPAFPSEDRHELLRQIASEDPVKPRRLERSIPAELEIIVLKAMEKRPQDRYATAQELADDLRRWLMNEPIRARRPNLMQRVGKWGRRNRSFVVAGVLCLFLALIMLAISNLVIWHEHEETREALRKAKLHEQEVNFQVAELNKIRNESAGKLRHSVEATEIRVSAELLQGLPTVDNVNQLLNICRLEGAKWSKEGHFKDVKEIYHAGLKRIEKAVQDPVYSASLILPSSRRWFDDQFGIVYGGRERRTPRPPVAERGLYDHKMTPRPDWFVRVEDSIHLIFRFGCDLDDLGMSADAEAAIRLVLDLYKHFVPGKDPVPEWVRNCERLVDVDGKFSALLSGQRQPGDNAERLGLAWVCQMYKHRYAAATHFYRDAFATDPKLAGDQLSAHRYNAACAAALAACGQGEETASLDTKDHAQLRQQALEWLRAELEAWRRFLDKEPGKARPAVQRAMQHWLTDGDFGGMRLKRGGSSGIRRWYSFPDATIGVRSEKSLAQLPEAERKEWQKLWQEVEALRQRAAEQPTKASSARP